MIRNVKKVQDLVLVKNAFISLYNKSESIKLVERLFDLCPGITIYSSGGTYKHLEAYFKEEGGAFLPNLIEASKYTGMPETDGGLVKTLHHKFFLGYLTETFSELHQLDLLREKAVAIDLVVVDLYPFEEVRKTPGNTIEECRGHIDVGGPSALRAAAKNFLRVMTLADYSHEAYGELLANIEHNNGHTTLKMRQKGFAETFRTLSTYDLDISLFAMSVENADLGDTYEIV